MILSSQIDRVLSALSVTQREGRQREKWITRQRAHTRQTPLSWCAPKDFLCQQKLWLTGGQAQAFVPLGQKQRYMANFYWRWLGASRGSGIMFRGVERHKSTDKNIWFQYIKSFSIFLSALLLCFSPRSLFVINTPKETLKKKQKALYVPALISWLQPGVI